MEREALRDYLLSCGWTSDDKKLRWKGQGKRTLREARDEQGLCDAVLMNPRVPQDLVVDAFERGNYRPVAPARL